MDFQDKKLTCVDCGCEFTFTAGEQEFYKEKGLDNEPKRCRECRAARFENREQNQEVELLLFLFIRIKITLKTMTATVEIEGYGE